MLNLKKDSLDWALSHALSRGDTDILPHAFEYRALKHNWDDVRAYLTKQDVLKWQTRPTRKCLSPKRRYGFRIATQLDPLDFLVFGALLYEIGTEIEGNRLQFSGSVDDSVWSCRFSPQKDGELFNPKGNFRGFNSASISLVASGEFSHVVITDIADFFPRLYLHRVEGALSKATTRQNHVKAIYQMLSQWNQTQSHGIPVGPAPSRLIAEIAIDDVDKILRSEGVPFLRYMDDYRLFAKSQIDAYEQLTTLANALFKNHGLTLQQEKTSIIPSEQFLSVASSTAESKELDSLREKFSDLLLSIGFDDSYGEIEYDDLDEAIQAEINSLNLEDLLMEHLTTSDIDQSMVRFLLRRLGQLDADECAKTILDNIENTFTVFPNVIEYFGRLRSLSTSQRQLIGQQLLFQIEESSISKLDFHKCWLFSLFSEGTEWGNQDKLVALYSGSQDLFSRRKLALALSKSGQDYWFRSRKDEVFEYGGWLRRAFLAGANCLPSDERKHWYDFLEPRLDLLEKSVVAWARSNAD